MEHNQSNSGLDQCHDCGVRRKQVANPTTNYGFVLPTPTDLVTDLPADFDVALQGVDTRLKALQPGTTLGDLAYSSATANTNTRLAIGSTGNVLTVAGGVPTWAAPTAAGMSWVSVLARTNMGSGTSYTASSLSGYNQLMIFIDQAGNTGTTGKYTITFNSDTSANYFFSGGGYTTGFPTAIGSGQRYSQASATTSIDFGEVAQTTNLDNSGAIHILGANTTAIKTGLLQSGMEYTTSTTQEKFTRHVNFRYLGTSVISSVTITATAGNFNNTGYMTIIGSVN
jgi:hypothetical protein